MVDAMFKETALRKKTLTLEINSGLAKSMKVLYRPARWAARKFGVRLKLKSGASAKSSNFNSVFGHKTISGGEIGAVRRLVNLHKFKSATELACEIDIESISLRNQIVVLRAYRGYTFGAYADEILLNILEGDLCLDGQEASLLIQSILAGGYTYKKKISLIYDVKSRAQSFSDDERNAIDLAVARLKISQGIPFDIVEEFGAGRILNMPVPWLIRYLPFLAFSRNQVVCDVAVDRILGEFPAWHPTVFPVLIESHPEVVVNGINSVDLDSVKNDVGGDLNVLIKSGQHASLSLQVAEIFSICVDEATKEYPGAEELRKERIFGALLKVERFDVIENLVSQSELFSGSLNHLKFKGYLALRSGENYSAKDYFEKVLNEDPSDSYAAMGLRIALPRTGGTISDLLMFRNRAGYGSRGAGRTGVRCEVGSDFTISKLFSGSYVQGLYSKRHFGHWKVLKNVFGARFINYSRVPKPEEIRSVFVIADEGVGDEIRTAQFYSYLSESYDSVRCTCDPRLCSIFRRSFPNIEFVPCQRTRKGVHELGGSTKRALGLSSRLMEDLNAEAVRKMELADAITFGQNVFFNHFIGEIPRIGNGAYLDAGSPRLASTGEIKVGIIWRSHYQTGWRRLMYLKLEELLPLFEVKGVKFQTIQHAMDEHEVELCSKHGIMLYEDLDMFNDFEGMAEFLQSFDLLIGISSAPIELGAALGVPVWLLGFSPENYFLRTKGGESERDHLTVNSTVLAPEWIDFTATRKECVDLTVDEAKRRLKDVVSADGVGR